MGVDAVECWDVSLDACVVAVLFDPLVEGVFYVVVSFGAVWSGLAGQAVVCVSVEWLAALCAVGVVLACFVVGVDDDAESQFEGDSVVDLWQALCGHGVGVDPCSVARAMHVVEDGLVEDSGAGVEVIVLLVVDVFGKGGL
mgnify:CR=1 FL=1